MSDAAPRLSEQEVADVCALADGTLPAERRAAVEASVAASPELRELLERQRRSLEATRALAREPTPASLREAVEAERRARVSRRRGAGWLVPRLGVAGALAAVVAVVAVAVLSGGPGGPTVAEAAQLADRPPSGAAPPPREGGTQLALDVEGVVFPDLLRSFGWKAVGVRRDQLDGRTATTVFYEKDARRVAYVVVAGRGLPRPSDVPGSMYRGVRFHTLRVNGRQAVTWRRLGHTCVLVGAAPRDELLALARYY
jgi:hypothetical protein